MEAFAAFIWELIDWTCCQDYDHRHRTTAHINNEPWFDGQTFLYAGPAAPATARWVEARIYTGTAVLTKYADQVVPS